MNVKKIAIAAVASTLLIAPVALAGPAGTAKASDHAKRLASNARLNPGTSTVMETDIKQDGRVAVAQLYSSTVEMNKVDFNDLTLGSLNVDQEADVVNTIASGSTIVTNSLMGNGLRGRVMTVDQDARVNAMVAHGSTAKLNTIILH